MPDTNSTTTFRADISQLKKEMQQASRAVRVANSEFKAATAGMDDWGSSADGLEAKLKQLNTVLKAQNKQVELAAVELAKAQAEYGENSAEAERAQISYNNFKAAASKTEKELRQYERKLDDVADETKDLDKATDDTGKGLKGFGDIAKVALGNLAADMVSKLVDVAVDAAKALVEAGVAAAAYADEVLTASEVTGLSTDTLQEYAYAAELIDTDLSDVEKALSKNIKSMASAQSGSKAYAEAYENLGVSVTDANGQLRNSEDVFWEVIDALGKVENESEADAIAMQLFGKSAQQLNPLIRTGSEGFRELAEEAHEAGAVLSEDTLDGLADVDDSIQRLNSQVSAFKTVVGAAIAPTLGALADGATDVLKALTNAFMAPEQSDLDVYLDDLESRIEDTQDQIDGIKTVELKADADIATIESYRSVLEKATKGEELSEFEKYQLKTAVEKLGGVIPGLAKAYDEETGSIDLTTEALRKNLEETEKQIRVKSFQEAIETAYKAANDAAIEAMEAQDAYKTATEDLETVLNGTTVDDFLALNPQQAEARARVLGTTANQLYILIQRQVDASAAVNAATEAEKEARAAAEARVTAIENLENEIYGESESTQENTKNTVANTEATEDQKQAFKDSWNPIKQTGSRLENNAKAQKKAADAADETTEAVKGEAIGARLLGAAINAAGDLIESNGDRITAGLQQGVTEGMEVLAKKAEASAAVERSALESVRQAYADQIETIRSNISQKISLWDKFSGGEDITVEEMVANLQSQTAGILQYKQEMEAVIAEYGDELGPDLVNTLQGMGADAANTWHHMWITMSQDNAPELFQELGDQWTQGLDLSEQIAKYSAGTLTAYQLATNKLGSTKIEWTGLRESVSEMTPELEAAINAAESAGVQIPDGMADGLRSGELTAHDAAVQLKNALQGTFNGLYEIAEQSGVDIPEGLSKGMEGSSEDYEAAIGQLTEALSTAGADAGTAAADSIGTAMEESSDTVESAAESTASSAADAADSQSSQFEAAGTSSGSAYIKGLRSRETMAKSAGTALAKAAKSGVAGVDMTQSGKFFAQGYINGINSLIAQVIAKAREMVRSAINAAKAEQQEGSPSKLTYQSGVYFTQGYILGIASEQKNLVRTVKGLVGSVISELAKASGFDFGAAGKKAVDAFSASMEQYADYVVGKIFYQNEAKISEFESEITRLQRERDSIVNKLQAESEKRQSALQKKINKTRNKRTKNRLKEQLAAEKAALKAQSKSIQDQYENLISTQEQYQQAYTTASSEMINRFQDAISEYQRSAEDLIESSVSGVTDKYEEKYNNLIDKQTDLIQKLQEADQLFEVGSSGVMIIGDIQDQTRRIREYTQGLQEIRDKISAELFDQITQYDLKEGAAYTKYLLGLSADELDAYNAAYTEKLKAANDAADLIYGQDIEQVAQDYQDEIRSAFEDLPAQLEELGMQAMQGFIDGFGWNTDYMSEEIRTFVAGMIDQFKQLLDIHSPSGVMYDLGGYTGEGFVDGVKSWIQQAKQAAAELASTVSTPLESIDTGSIQGAVPAADPRLMGGVVNNYNLVQNNNSPKALTALETYQARRRQIALVKAFA